MPLHAESFLDHRCLSNDLWSQKLTTYSHTLTASVGVCKSCCIGKALIYLRDFYHCTSIKHPLSHLRTVYPRHLRKCVFWPVRRSLKAQQAQGGNANCTQWDAGCQNRTCVLLEMRQVCSVFSPNWCLQKTLSGSKKSSEV